MEFFPNEELSSEAKKDMRHAYLHDCGITAKLSEIFEKLLEAHVKPENPLDFIREELGVPPIPTDTIEDMEHELDDAYREIRRLRGILKGLGIDYTNEPFDESDVGPNEFENVVTDFNNSLSIVVDEDQIMKK